MKLNKILLAFGLLGAAMSSAYADPVSAVINPQYDFQVTTEIGAVLALTHGDESPIQGTVAVPLQYNGTSVQGNSTDYLVYATDRSKGITVALSGDIGMMNGNAASAAIIPLAVSFGGAPLTNGTTTSYTAAQVWGAAGLTTPGFSVTMPLVFTPGAMPASAAGRYAANETLTLGTGT